MNPHITRKIDQQTFPDPTGLPPDQDPWRDFRDVERIDLQLEFRFRHSLGKVSRFFLELEQRRLMATRCPACNKVWMPPRAICGDASTVAADDSPSITAPSVAVSSKSNAACRCGGAFAASAEGS